MLAGRGGYISYLLRFSSRSLGFLFHTKEPANTWMQTGHLFTDELHKIAFLSQNHGV